VDDEECWHDLGSLGLEITYVTGNGDPHHVRQADENAGGATRRSDRSQSGKGTATPLEEATSCEGKPAQDERFVGKDAEQAGRTSR
jgi:hypothetical protein